MNYLLARQLSVFSVAPVAADPVTSAFTVGDSVSILGMLDGADERQVVEYEEISAIGSGMSNPVPVAWGTVMTVSEILTAQTPLESELRKIFSQTKYIQVSYRYAGQTTTIVGLITEGRRTFARGKSTYTITLHTVDIGAPNPSFS